MDADVSGGTSQSHVSSGTGRNPNGSSASVPASAAGAMPASLHPREPQDGETAGLSLPGILHFIQYEWSRFHAEKCVWETEREELRSQVAFLQGERKGQESMKQDLVRRIKMLEFALKQERAKYQKLKSGTDQNPEKKQETEPILNGQEGLESETAHQVAWKEGRQLLRKYLEEVGYSDTILNMRSKRVRSLLGRCSPEVNGPLSHDPSPEPKSHAGGDSLLVRQIEEQIKRNAGKEGSTEHPGRSVLDKIPFLRSCDDEDDSDEDEDFLGIATDCIDGPQKNKKSRGKMFGDPMTTALDPEEDEDEDDSEDALSEFDFLGSGEEGEGAGEACISGDGRELGTETEIPDARFQSFRNQKPGGRQDVEVQNVYQVCRKGEKQEKVICSHGLIFHHL